MSETNDILDNVIRKCAGDEPPFCMATCPLHVDMRGAIELIRDGRFEAALSLIRETLPFAGVLGRICTHPCEVMCQRNDVDSGISIMALKRAAADHGKAAEWDLTIGREKGERIAVVGSGPAGLMAAYVLRKMGYPVTIFEALPVIGGMLTVGIPQYRLPRDVLNVDLEIIHKLGIEIKTNTSLGKDISLADLKSNFGAVFIATGAPLSRMLPIDGADLQGVLWGMDYLREVGLGKAVKIGKRVVVVGGGNVAVDTALTALRQGAEEVHVTTRKSRDAIFAEPRNEADSRGGLSDISSSALNACREPGPDIPIYTWEINQLLDEGVILHTSWGPKRIFGENGQVRGIEMVSCTRVPDKQGRSSLSVDASETMRLAADTVILAVGQAPDSSFITGESGIACAEDGYILADETTLATAAPGFFAGGDGVYGPKSVIDALASGKRAAISIDRYLRNADLHSGRQQDGPLKSRLKVNLERAVAKDRQPMPVLPKEQRIGNFREVDLGLTPEQAQEEARRCLSCECKQCMAECPFLEQYCRSPKELAQKFLDGDFRENPIVPYSCNLCELCEKLCPEGLNVGDMCMAIRELMVEEKIGPLPAHQFVRRDQEYVKSDAVALTRPGKGRQSQWAFFPGCSLAGSSPELVVKMYDYLEQRLPGTGIILRCCGAPSHFLGDRTEFEAMNQGISIEVKKLGASGVIIGCPDCYRTIKEGGADFEMKSVYEVLVEKGLPAGARASAEKTFSLHDSCTARNEPAFTQQVRTLIHKMGYKLDEMPFSREKTRCCGAGGMIPYVNLPLFRKLAKRRADEAAFDLLTYCATCRDTLASTGKATFHVLDLIFNPHWEANLKKPAQTGKSKRNNQAELKKLLEAASSGNGYQIKEV